MTSWTVSGPRVVPGKASAEGGGPHRHCQRSHPPGRLQAQGGPGEVQVGEDRAGAPRREVDRRGLSSLRSSIGCTGELEMSLLATIKFLVLDVYVFIWSDGFHKNGLCSI